MVGPRSLLWGEGGEVIQAPDLHLTPTQSDFDRHHHEYDGDHDHNNNDRDHHVDGDHHIDDDGICHYPGDNSNDRIADDDTNMGVLE